MEQNEKKRKEKKRNKKEKPFAKKRKETKKKSLPLDPEQKRVLVWRSVQTAHIY